MAGRDGTVKKEKIYLIIQSILCILLVLLLAAAVTGIFREGTALKADNPLEWVFSREKTAERLRPLLPLFLVFAVTTAVGLIAGVKDENSAKGVKTGKIQNRAAGGKALRTVLLIAAVCLIAAGIFNGSARDVLGKAVKICTECVGLG